MPHITRLKYIEGSVEKFGGQLPPFCKTTTDTVESEDEVSRRSERKSIFRERALLPPINLIEDYHITVNTKGHHPLPTSSI